MSDNPFGSPPPTDPFGNKTPPGDSSASDPFAAQPSEAWRTAAPPHDPFADPTPRSRNADGAIASLVLGILSIVFCPLCAPFAWYLGRKAERLVDASGGTLSGRGEATAGKILGMVATVLTLLAIVVFVVLLLGLAAGSDVGGSFTVD